MRGKNQESISRGLAIVMALALITCSGSPRVNSEESVSDTLVFEGTLEKLGPDPGIVSGRLAVYRLAKYRVNKVCKGEYDESEIVVDHTLFSGKEFDRIKVGDQLCVRVKVSNKIHVQYAAEGIRSPSEVVKTFYIAHEEIKPIDDRQACCEGQK